MKRFFVIALSLLFLSIAFTNCTVVRQGEVGVKRTFGKYSDIPYMEGWRFFNPITSSIVKITTQTQNLEVALNLPSKEGLNIVAEISILYSIQAAKAPDLLRNIGINYESNVILPVFRSAVADVSARYFAKDMHTGERAVIEEAIREQMHKTIKDKGITIETVLVKSIQLPRNLARAIEEKLEAEQRALRMEFTLQEERREAERKRIEAEGVRDAQQIIAEGLSPQVLQFKSIEAFLELSKSPNTKIIVSDGDMPVLLTPMGEENNSSNSSLRTGNPNIKN
jgi:prohibitin 1